MTFAERIRAQAAAFDAARTRLTYEATTRPASSAEARACAYCCRTAGERRMVMGVPYHHDGEHVTRAGRVAQARRLDLIDRIEASGFSVTTEPIPEMPGWRQLRIA